MSLPAHLDCLKCRERMQPGYLLEQGHANMRSSTTWSAGEPRKSFWMGLKAATDTYETRTYRCTGCGYLESYAHKEAG